MVLGQQARLRQHYAIEISKIENNNSNYSNNGKESIEKFEIRNNLFLVLRHFD